MKRKMRMNDIKTRQEMLDMLELMLDEDRPYNERLEAYEYLLIDVC